MTAPSRRLAVVTGGSGGSRGSGGRAGSTDSAAKICRPWLTEGWTAVSTAHPAPDFTYEHPHCKAMLAAAHRLGQCNEER